MKINRIHLDAIDSTNSYAKERLMHGAEFPDITLIDTEEQTAGRGQRGNSWESERGKNLTFTLVCHPTLVSPSRQFVLSQAIALAVCETLSQYAQGITVKWPNDIYWGDKKISGTLIECDLFGRKIENCIIGTGINVNQTVFLSDAPNPVSLAQILGDECDREEILLSTATCFAAYYDLIEKGGSSYIHEEYMLNLYRRKGLHRYEDAASNEQFEAAIADIEPTGHLLLKTQEGEVRRYEFKEVRFII